MNGDRDSHRAEVYSSITKVHGASAFDQFKMCVRELPINEFDTIATRQPAGHANIGKLIGRKSSILNRRASLPVSFNIAALSEYDATRISREVERGSSPP